MALWRGCIWMYLWQAWAGCSIVVRGLSCNYILPESSYVILLFYLHFLGCVTCALVLTGAIKGHASKLAAEVHPFYCMTVYCLYPASLPPSCRKERNFAASLYGLGRHNDYFCHSSETSHALEWFGASKSWKGFTTTSLAGVKYGVVPADMQQPYQQNTVGSHSPLASTVLAVERIFTLAAAPAEVQKRVEETKQEK